ncbi:hypothetical protein MRB53_020767 [Persea americana]|uniref:Uncharacterized protein n=1 Tax=Persea americana TaxID=3435 RepID=A0ACC2L2B0_PERAE|nr:hypothetical protein MRB53_020767 [Persea americana]
MEEPPMGVQRCSEGGVGTKNPPQALLLHHRFPCSQKPVHDHLIIKEPISISRRPSPLHPTPVALFLIPYNPSPPGSIFLPADPDAPSSSSCTLQPISADHLSSNPSSFPPSQDARADPDSPSSSSRRT